MSRELPIMVPIGLNKLTRICKDHQQPFYALFLKHVGQNTLITTKIRKEIIKEWIAIAPLIPKINLQVYLSSMEKKYWAQVPRWEQPELVNKITAQTMELQETILDAAPANTAIVVKKALAVDELNKTIARVNKLDAMAPIAQFVIQTNVSEIDIATEMNAIDITPEEEEKQ